MNTNVTEIKITEMSKKRIRLLRNGTVALQYIHSTHILITIFGIRRINKDALARLASYNENKFTNNYESKNQSTNRLSNFGETVL